MTCDIGQKNDNEKPKWDLLPFLEVQQIVNVLTFGAKKYDSENWKFVPDARNRYFAALVRHLTAWREGELIDKESGLPHLAHAGCCLLFIMWFDRREVDG